MPTTPLVVAVHHSRGELDLSAERVEALRAGHLGWQDLGGRPHWVQGWETYGDTTAVHSPGHFIVDMQLSRQVQEGVFVEIVLWTGGDGR